VYPFWEIFLVRERDKADGSCAKEKLFEHVMRFF
jgi:hypothetical protein